MSPTLLLALALAVSLAGNAFLFRLHSAAVEDKGKAEAAGAAWMASANTCTDSVTALVADGTTRHQELLGAIKGSEGRVKELQQQALASLAAKPDNPADPCGSLERYLKAQIKADKEAKP